MGKLKKWLGKTWLYKKWKIIVRANHLEKQLKYLENHSDITKLTPATGELRERQLKLIGYYDEFFNLSDVKELNIKPFIMFGTLIGLVRHGGFIPWDDDIDCGLMRDDFLSLVDYFKKKDCLFYKKYFISKNNKNIENYYQLAREHSESFFAVWDYDYELHIVKYDSKFKYILFDVFCFDFYKEHVTFKDVIIEKKRIEKGAPRTNPKDYIEYINQKCAFSSLLGTSKDKLMFSLHVPLKYNGYITKNLGFVPNDYMFPLQKIKFEGTYVFCANKPQELLEDNFEKFMDYPDDVGFSHHLGHYLD